MTDAAVAWLFPGQGSQVVGMGKALAERYTAAARTFDEANEALGFDLRALCFEGPAAELDRTANTQPALLATGVAALRAAIETGMTAEPVCAAGHSLGEFTALVAAGGLELADALRLVRRRGELMQAADASGGMGAVLGLDVEAVEQVLAGTGLVVANDNAPGQVVVSGPLAAFAGATERLKAAGAKRVLPLRVSGAFHSPSMRAVAPDLAAALARVTFHPLRIPVVANVDAELHHEVSDFRTLLERQVWSPVRWASVMRRAAGEGATVFVELGAGTVLSGLAKRIVPGVRTVTVSDPATLEEARNVLR